MKFGLFGLPTIPGTLGERRRLRPIAHQTERWQTMFDEVVELTRIAEDLGFAYFARQGVPGVVFKYLFSHFGFARRFANPPTKPNGRRARS
jgi:hypothetical protein